MGDDSGVIAARQRVIVWSGAGAEIVREFPVLDHASGLDSPGYVVHQGDGAVMVVLTRRGQPFHASRADLKPLLVRYEEASRATRAALAALRPAVTPAQSVGELREAVVPLLRPYVSRIELFGSFARGEQRLDSDVDLLIRLRPESERPPLGLEWFALEEELSQRAGYPVEMVSEDALSAHVRPYIEADRIVLYGE